MPVAVIKTYAEESGKSIEECEKAWEEAKEQADKKFDKKDEHYWAYVNIVTQRKLGIEKKKKDAEKAKKKESKKKT